MQQPIEQKIETETEQIKQATSVCPSGEIFQLPAEEDYKEEETFEKLVIFPIL